MIDENKNPEGEEQEKKNGSSDLDTVFKLFDRKLYNRAAYELKVLFSEDKEKYIGPIKSRYKNYVSRGLYEEALAIGMAIFSEEKNNGTLANQLGNFARKLGDQQQAISMYEHAMQASESPLYVQYNLGATLANVGYFDHEAMSAGNFYNEQCHFVLPYYLNRLSPKKIKPDPGYMESIDEQVLKFKALKHKEVISDMETKMKEINPETQLYRELEGKIKKMSAANPEAKTDDYQAYFQKLLTDFRAQGENTDWIFYNVAVFNISNDQFLVGFKALNKISEPASFPYYKLLQAICLNLHGRVEEAFKLISQLLSKDRFDRLLNVNIGLIYRKLGKKVMASKYLIYGYYLTQLSDGLLERQNIIEKAHEFYSNHNWQEARRLYLLLIDEKVTNESVFYNYAQIMIKMDDHHRANSLLNQIIALNGEYKKLAEIQIDACFTDLINKGDQIFLAKKYRNAIDFYSKALIYKKKSVVLKKILECYEFFKLNESDSLARDKVREKLKNVLAEEQTLAEREKNTQKLNSFERERLEMIEMGRLNIMQKKYYNAIEPLEKAFRMKPERQVFMQLASLYKGLKQNDKLVDLVMRYKNYQEHEKKMSKYRPDDSEISDNAVNA